MNFWDQILKYLQQNVSQQKLRELAERHRFRRHGRRTLFVSVPDRETRAWLETEYAGLIRSAIRDLGLPVRHVSYESQPPTGTIEPGAGRGGTGRWTEPARSALNPKFTFDSFVVGACNQFAHAAAQVGGRRIRRAATTRCSSTAAWGWARRT